MIGWLITVNTQSGILKLQRTAKEVLKNTTIHKDKVKEIFAADIVEPLAKSIIGLFCIGAEDKVNEMYEKSKKTPIKIIF